MKSLLFGVILGAFCVFVTNVNGYTQSMTTMDKIEEVYDTYAATLSPDHLEWFSECLSRCTVIESLPEEVSTYNYLSEVPLMDKIVTTFSHDTTYDEDSFNPLKYMLNYHKKFDQYFRIGDTNYYLKVEKQL